LCKVGRDLADNISKTIQSTHGKSFEAAMQLIASDAKHSLNLKAGDNLIR
jgi:hypothetical protein